MITDYKLGEWYWTKDSDGEPCAFLFLARQGQFIIGVSEYMHHAGRIVDQLHEMCAESIDNEGVNVYLHYADECFATEEEAKESDSKGGGQHDRNN